MKGCLLLVNGLSRRWLKHQDRAHRVLGPDNRIVADIEPCNAGKLRQRLQTARGRHRKTECSQSSSTGHVRRLDAEAPQKGAGCRHLDRSPWRGDGKAFTACGGRAGIRKEFEKSLVLLRLLGDNDYAGDAGNTVRMLLKRRFQKFSG